MPACFFELRPKVPLKKWSKALSAWPPQEAGFDRKQVLAGDGMEEQLQPLAQG
jgi:hypothetical protein